MTAPDRVVGHRVVTDEAEALRLLDNDRVIGLDTETSGLSPYVDTIATVQMYGDDTGTLALFHPRGVMSDRLRDFMGRRKCKWLVHNGVSFDIPFLLANGVSCDSEDWYDTMVGETVVVGSGRRDVSVSLRSTVKRRLDIELDKGLSTSHWMAEDLTPEQISYATSDVVHLPALWRSQLERAKASGQDRAIDFEMALVPVFARMTFNGMPISRTKLEEFLGKQAGIIEELKPKFEAEFGDINPSSWQQVAKAFKARGIDVPNTRKETMIDLAQHGGLAGQLAELLLEYRKPAQRLKMYRPEWVSKHVIGGRAHPRFWQCSTDTTRVASSDPNLQQVPRDMRDPWGWEPGYKIISADYSQIEVRIAAFLAHDEKLLAALEDDDAHSAIAATINGIAIADVTKEMRRAAKALTFTLLFGGGTSTFYSYARLQGSAMTVPEAEALVVQFFGSFEGLARMRAWAENLADNKSMARLKLPAGHVRVLRGSQLRSTIVLNTLVQGRAATGIKYAMLECKKRGLDKYLAVQVHDELVAAVPDAEARDYAIELQAAMLAGMREVIDATVKVETRIGDSWHTNVALNDYSDEVTTPGGKVYIMKGKGG